MDSLFRGQWQILERVAQGAPQAEVLEAIVRLIESQSEGMLCSILLFDASRQTLHHGAAPSLPAEYIQVIDGSTIGPDAGSCGATAYTQQPVIVEDTSVHPNWAPWRELAERHHLRACWSTPIFSPERSLLGTFAMYYREPRRPTAVEQHWIATATHLTSIAITLAKQAELQEQLRQAQRMEAVGKLAGGVAHDFNNLLSVMISYASMISDSLAPADPLRADVEEIRRAADRASELTRQLLAFGRQQVMQPRVLDLPRALAGLEKMLRRIVGEDIVFSLVPAVGLGKIQVDPGQLEQVVMNLVVNARDAMPQGGGLTITTANVRLDHDYAALHPGVTPGPYVKLSVTDTGQGMAAATRARVFEPFFTTKEQGKGTGLGLSTVWGIVTQSGGHVSVQSTAGQGTTFDVFFPSVSAELDDRPVESAAPTTVVGNETVLVVEDEEQVRTLVCSVLGRAGYTVLEAQNGGEGLLVCEKYPRTVHLLLTDVVMPRMNGRELAERLLLVRPDMKVLYVSGYAENIIVKNGVVDSAITLLQKPITPQILLRKVREVLDAGG
jgi:two-component system, cell cycle sensor histidine kinase and response regulator CckA